MLSGKTISSGVGTKLQQNAILRYRSAIFQEKQRLVWGDRRLLDTFSWRQFSSAAAD
jgi:hypothetical protein